ncbi:acyltransferase family protein [Persicitalea jodogahamensis]|uniref:Membrane protein n=1 Tax=Persicitalea jodogahamensis TaxID=402147 RepID=A0A8J3GB26_9BACT|nr:heparan-alpha-glucosaminide N-acetyltransferase domain-containing protein [Persicitalea jodogahamensis]GHB78316.1 membrane protein [Persicitalea jodogahamensis]
MGTTSQRLISLDALRGFTIAAMITVNFPGLEKYVYPPLHHTAWNGLTFTDLIAPIFLFVIGVSIALAYSRRLDQNAPKAELHRKIIIRALKIFAVGMFLNLMPDFDFADARWTGTLHRIAFVFLFCGLLFLHTNWREQAWIGALVLVLYWLAMTLIPTPGVGEVMLEPGVNLAAWIDQQLLPGRMWQGNWDPEGILSTFPATVTGITGMLAGRLLLSKYSPNEKANYLMAAGLLSSALGYGWSLTFPLNEGLWTSSFVLLTSGFASMLLGALYFVVDILGRRWGTGVGVIFGANAITVYVLADVFALFFYGLLFGNQTLNELTVNAMISAGFVPKFASMVYALAFTAVNFIPAYILYKRKIFIKL